jgi:hypothetical protein
VTYAPAARGVAFTAVADDLAVNQATVDFDHEGTLVTSESGERTLTIRADASGRGGRGTGFGREGDYTVTWDEARTCIGVDGTWSTTVGALAWRTEVTGYDRCVESCPMSGGRIGWSSASGAITVTYDGSSTARWSVDGRRDREGTVELLCGE